MTDVTLRVHEDGADDERIEQLTAFLRAELRELTPVSAPAGVAAPGAKALDPTDIGTLLATISQSTVLAALITAVSSWLGQRRGRSVTVEADGDALELTGAPDAAERTARAEWLRRRRTKRYALIIAAYEFADQGLSSLRAPAHDAARLGEVLADPRIGGFDVQTLINSPAFEVNEAVEEFFADREPDDLLVLHFSGHGVKDEAGELHFATSGTKLNRLAGTAVSADFVARRMNRSRSRRIVLLLDCCYSGAFGRGMVARAGGAVGLEEQFGGSGRAVITASSAMEYAFEGAAVADASESEPSVFTSALVEGLESGEADRDQDGHVGLDELYEYVYDRVRRVTPHQTPGKWMLDVRGDLHIARRARPVQVPAALPTELQEALDHSLPGVRAGAIPELRRMLTVRHEGRVLAARLALRRLADDDSRMVASSARSALAELGEEAELGRSRVPSPTSLLDAREEPETGESDVAAKSAAPAQEAVADPGPTVRPQPETAPADSPATTQDGPEPTAEADSPRTLLAASSSATPSTTPAPRTSQDNAVTTPAPTPATTQALTAAAITALPRLAAALALTLMVIGLTTTQGGVVRVLGGDASFNTFLFATLWPWALAATTFVLVCRDHKWAHGAALGLLAGTTGLQAGTIGLQSSGWYLWLFLGMAGVALAATAYTRPWWLALATGVLGAVGVFVVASSETSLESINGDGQDVVFLLASIGLIGLAGYRVWQERAWFSTIAPALLLLDVTITLSAEPPQFVLHASLAGLIVVPLIATLTSATARFAGYAAVSAGLLVRAGEYVAAGEPSFATFAYLLLPLAAATAAYYSCER
ncbi:caspase family protein [Lentzea sp. NPDC051213]|uniref:caspase family protein n=1 Tax=Lentzea sp. NPDC051213 TaxID=3364126 RepID=UPI00378FC87B